MTDVSLSLVRFIIRASSPEGLTRLMIKNNVKDRMMYQYAPIQQTADGKFWYSSYLKDPIKRWSVK